MVMFFSMAGWFDRFDFFTVLLLYCVLYKYYTIYLKNPE